MRSEKTISAKVHKTIANEVDSYAAENEKSRSRVIKEALYLFMDRKKEFEVHEDIQKVLDQSELFNDLYAEDFYVKKQNQRVSVKLKELTFIQFMDKNLSIVYLANKRHMDKESLRDMLRSSLKSMEDRAEYHGFEKEWKARYDDPIPYTTEYLEQKSAEKKAFEDLMDSM